VPTDRLERKKIKFFFVESSKFLALIFLMIAPVCFLFILDYLNIEALSPFNSKFYFELTWKGRLFYLLFLWLFLLESIIQWGKVKALQRKMSFQKTVLLLSIPTFLIFLYLVMTNFLGASNYLLSDIAKQLGIKDWYWINFHWPLALEYIVFSLFFTALICINYEKKSVFMFFAFPLVILWGMSAMYLIDVLYPYGKLKFIQILSLPTSAWAVSLMEFLGCNVIFRYDTSSGLPVIRILAQSPTGEYPAAAVGWPCSGVHSLFLYVLIIVPLLKQYGIAKSKKVAYFLIGSLFTYTMNILRVVSYFLVYLYYGGESARVFHDIYGEFFFLTFIITFIAAIAAIESGMAGRFLVRLSAGFRRLILNPVSRIFQRN